jgi:hypothetical protein
MPTSRRVLNFDLLGISEIPPTAHTIFKKSQWFKKNYVCWMRWPLPLVLALLRQKQADLEVHGQPSVHKLDQDTGQPGLRREILSEKKKKFLFTKFVCIFLCLVHIHTWYQRCQKRALDPLELQLQAAVSSGEAEAGGSQSLRSAWTIECVRSRIAKATQRNPASKNWKKKKKPNKIK